MVASTRASPLPAVHKTGVWWATASGRPGGVIHINPTVVAKRLMLEFGSASEVLILPADGVVSGTVLDAATPVANCEVSLFHRRTRRCMATTRTNAAGFFAFPDLIVADGAYFVAAFPPASLQKNALIFDSITPA